MTQIIKAEEIRKAFTDKVNEYLSEGMQINIWSMSGTQGEKAKVDVTDGVHIYRISLFRECGWIDDDNFTHRTDTMVLTVEKFEQQISNRVNILYDSTLWNGRGETVYSKTWYALGDIYSNNAFTDDVNTILSNSKKSDERYALRRGKRHTVAINEKNILKVIHNHYGYKRLYVNDIDCVYKTLYADGVIASYIIKFKPELKKPDIQVKLPLSA